MRRGRLVAATAAALVAVLVLGVAVLVREVLFAPKTITAYFTSAVGIYPGDGVRVAGVRVGKITAIRPAGAVAQFTLEVDHGVPIPADAKAVVVAQSLIAARYVQLAPVYQNNGPTMADGAVIPAERTAVPVEWDEVKAQLTRLATELGPRSDVAGTSVSRFINSAANALDGNGDKLRSTLAELSGLGRVLAEGGGNLVDIIKNLARFVDALRDSNTQIVQFEDRLATLTSVLDNSRSDLDAALQKLSQAVGEVQQFIAGTRDKTSEQLQRLANVTQNLVDHKIDLENILHVAPNAFANAYKIYDPDNGANIGAFVFNNFSSPVDFVCGSIAAVQNTTAAETAKLCSQYLGPALRLLNFNYIPIPTSPYLTKSTSPDKVIYTEPGLAPGGSGPKQAAPEQPPAVSAYTGAGDVPAPPGFGPPGAPLRPSQMPVYPAPALYPGAPIPTVTNVPPAPGPASVSDLLLPGSAAPSPGDAPPGPLPAEAGSPAPGGTP
jgi:phospholipid/cholesterol/gamma-HCH transport system substrate-binding protein